MSTSIRSYSSISVLTSGVSNPVTLPSTPVAGNYLLYLVSPDKNISSFTPPPGFTLVEQVISGGISAMASVKVSEGNESGPISGSWSVSRPSKAIILEIQADGELSLGDSISNYTDSTVTSLGSGSITTSSNTAFAVAMYSNDSAKAAPTDPNPTGSWTGGLSSNPTIFENWDATAGVGEPGFALAYGVPPPDSTYETTYTHDGNPDQSSIILVTFLESTPSGVVNSLTHSVVNVGAKGGIGNDTQALLDDNIEQGTKDSQGGTLISISSLSQVVGISSRLGSTVSTSSVSPSSQGFKGSEGSDTTTASTSLSLLGGKNSWGSIFSTLSSLVTMEGGTGAEDTVQTTAATSTTVSGSKQASGTSSESVATSTSATGNQPNNGSISDTIATSVTVSGSKETQGLISDSILLSQPATGVKSTYGSITDSVSVVVTVSGGQIKQGTISEVLSVSNLESGFKAASNPSANSLASDTTAQGNKDTSGSTGNSLTVTVSAVGGGGDIFPTHSMVLSTLIDNLMVLGSDWSISMAFKNNDLVIQVDDSVGIGVENSSAATYTLRDYQDRSVEILSKSIGSGITISNGVMYISLDDTELNIEGDYFEELQVTVSGNKRTVFQGQRNFKRTYIP